MICSSKKVKADKQSFNNMLNHLSNDEDNEQVIILDTHDKQISKDQAFHLLGPFLDVATADGDKYCMRQFMFNSKEALTKDQLLNFREDIKGEFNLHLSNHDVYTFLHKKQKKDGGFVWHGHFLTNNRGFENDRVIKDKNSKRREEKLCRIFELENNHPVIQGAHNKAVLAQLARDGYARIADLKNALETDREELNAIKTQRSHYSAATYQRAKQDKQDKAFKDYQAEAYDIFQSLQQGQNLKDSLAQQGFHIEKGQKAGFILSKNGVLLGSARKCFGNIKNKTLTDILAGKPVRHKNNHGLSNNQFQSLTKLNTAIEALEQRIENLQSQKIDTGDLKLMQEMAKTDLKKSGVKFSQSRFKRQLTKTKEEAENLNDKIQIKIGEYREKQEGYISKIENTCAKTLKRQKQNPQTLGHLMQQLAKDDRFRAMARCSGHNHEYTLAEGLILYHGFNG